MTTADQTETEEDEEEEEEWKHFLQSVLSQLKTLRVTNG